MNLHERRTQNVLKYLPKDAKIIIGKAKLEYEKRNNLTHRDNFIGYMDAFAEDIEASWGWCPEYPENKVAIIISIEKHPYTDREYYIAIWGNDDYALEKVFSIEKELVKYLKTMKNENFTSQEKLFVDGFTPF